MSGSGPDAHSKATPPWKTVLAWAIFVGALVLAPLAVVGSIQKGTWPVSIPMMVVTVAVSIWASKRISTGGDLSATPRMPEWALALIVVGALIIAGVVAYLYL